MTQQPNTEIPELTLGWRLKMALEHGNVSRGEMAAELGVDPATITRWTGDRGAAPKKGFLRQWDKDLAADVTQVAKLWRKAAGELSADTAAAFTKTLGQVTAAQEKVTAACG